MAAYNTDTPWKSAGRYCLENADGNTLFEVCGKGVSNANDTDLRDFILHRVNAHDDLVAELQKCLKAFGDYSNMKPDGKLGKSVRIALAKAGKDVT